MLRRGARCDSVWQRRDIAYGLRINEIGHISAGRLLPHFIPRCSHANTTNVSNPCHVLWPTHWLDRAATETLHVYHIGNSLTRSITMDRLHLLFAEGGIDYQFSTQLAAGCTLSRHWAAERKACRPANGKRTSVPASPGNLAARLDQTQTIWPLLGGVGQPQMGRDCPSTLSQPHERRSSGTSPLPEIRPCQSISQAFLLLPNMAKPTNHQCPREGPRKAILCQHRFSGVWERTYPYDEQSEKPTGDAYQSHDYFQQLITKLNDEFREKLTKPVGMIPVGDVWDAQ